MPNFRTICTAFADLLRCLTCQNEVKLHGWPVKLVTKYLPLFLFVVLLTTIMSQFFGSGPHMRCTGINRFEHFQPRHLAPRPETQRRKAKFTTPKPIIFHEECQRRDFSLLKATSKGERNADVVDLRYYNNINAFLTGLFLLSLIPSFLSRVRRIRGIVNIVTPEQTTDENEQFEMRAIVLSYLNSAGSHKTFMIEHTLTKILALTIASLQWFSCYMFFGNAFISYGIKSLLFRIDPNFFERYFPNPMRSLFPVISWCDKVFYNGPENFEEHIATCSLPGNSWNQWTFLVYWFLIVFTIFANFISCLFYATNLIPYIRMFHYKMFICSACPDMVRAARSYEEDDGEGNVSRKQVCRFSVVHVKLSFADFVALEIVRKNMKRIGKEKEFLMELASTENQMIEIKPVNVQVPQIIIHPAEELVELELHEFVPSMFFFNYDDASGSSAPVPLENHRL